MLSMIHLCMPTSCWPCLCRRSTRSGVMPNSWRRSCAWRLRVVAPGSNSIPELRRPSYVLWLRRYILRHHLMMAGCHLWPRPWSRADCCSFHNSCRTAHEDSLSPASCAISNSTVATTTTNKQSVYYMYTSCLSLAISPCSSTWHQHKAHVVVLVGCHSKTNTCLGCSCPLLLP